MRGCLAFDLEVDPSEAKIFALAAVHHEDIRPAILAKSAGRAKSADQEGIEGGLDRLESALDDVEFPIGHNILRHDLEHLFARRPGLNRLMGAPIDTLWLNPLAFPRNPYHHLVKHYQDGRLQVGHVNDPEQDARLVFDVLRDQLEAFRALGIETPDALVAYHYLTTRLDRSGGFDAVFGQVRGQNLPSRKQALAAIWRLLRGKACEQAIEEVLLGLTDPRAAWPLAYALAWISVAGGTSVMPPWVRAEFTQAAEIVRALRGGNCGHPACDWCTKMNDPIQGLQRWFGYPSFRPEPVDDSGHPLQQCIVEAGIGGDSVLGILPTGTGKSVCYQIPALNRFERTGALSVVISPLVALMADQVQGMERSGISSAVTVNGMLSMPEREDALNKVRMGDASILLISPEQLRSVSIIKALKQREVGLWVLDEAHCISKWGHDFRPDYRYVARFIEEFHGKAGSAPIICLTATAKPEVVAEIRNHFTDLLAVEMRLFDGGASRTNLSFEVLPTGKEGKLSDIFDVISAKLPAEGASGAVVYCATRKETERVAAFLKQQGLAADHYHAGLSPEQKTDTQERFRIGQLRVIAATNAFGMGIDKPDIRLVVHGDIPGSLENYLQESGRAGRDRDPANCVLLFGEEDVERQFKLSARSRLERHEIGAILKALRRMDERTKNSGTVVATSGEIVKQDEDRDFIRDTATDDTRVKTAVSWLEESALLKRKENRVQVFPSSLLVQTLGEAAVKLKQADLTQTRRKQLYAIITHIMNAPIDEGISTDELCGASGLAPGALTKALMDLETLGIARNDTALTGYVHVGIKDDSRSRLAGARSLEKALVRHMRELAPDLTVGEVAHLNLSETCQTLRREDGAELRPDIVEKLLQSMARDGRDLEGGRGNIGMRKLSRNTLAVTLQRPWGAVEKTADVRWQAADRLLEHLLGKVKQGARGKDIQVDTTMGHLAASLTGDVVIQSFGVKEITKLMERALLWLHEQGVITLGKGLTVFRQAMTVHLEPSRAPFTVADFQPLEEHYREQTIQTHVMAKYAETGLETMAEAMKLSEDYFIMDQDRFQSRWMPGKATETRRQTTGKSWKKIVDDLGNPVQQEIVADDRERTNVLVLAGPGSGKTRVLVHRIAYLLRIRREDPRGILVLTYNRHAAAEIRARLRHLVGEDANGVTVSTCHALAMRLVGASFVGDSSEIRDFDGIVMEAVRQLNGDGLSKSEAEAQRDALMQGYRWILVDEYQDIGPEEYALIAAVAGRSLEDPDLRLSLFAVGDDDQNIYAFAGASVSFIRQFEEDYRAKPKFLTENYRSSRNIIEAANAVIEPASGRMKEGRDIAVDHMRSLLPGGGMMAGHDPVAQGRVQVLDCPPGDQAQAMAALDELVRLSRLDPDWKWSRVAIIAREWQRLEPVRAYAEHLEIPVELANETLPSIWRLREMQTLIAGLRCDPTALLGVQDILMVLNEQPLTRWVELIAEGIADLARELGTKSMPVPDVVEWLAEWSRDTRGEQRRLLLLTAHRAKGLEFDHVVILDGGWKSLSKGEDADAPRRLFYVAMTRARHSLSVIRQGPGFVAEGAERVVTRTIQREAVQVTTSPLRYQMPNMEIVDLSYAGRLRHGDAGLNAIAQAQVGDPLTLSWKTDRWLILNQSGQILGRMAKSWKPPQGMTLTTGHIGAIVEWRKTDNDETFRQHIKRDRWETVLPELVFADRSPST
ncbi:RecQ family ATP-dependent DNA helicase [uncultured Pelagimonas sp.]|uniref:RecQ family ATP-dependent DNA helicase n=1 Tax=uncultured Pelagimonas sp. TaxID=1618102 RepID=UPI002622DA1C|nr:RecQ family ATP-dependent DNA helicase [uncultured Pelagimonas sp.]